MPLGCAGALGEDGWQHNVVETALRDDGGVCANCGYGALTGNMGFSGWSASLTTRALEMLQIACQLVNQANVDRLSVEKET
jgi:hypothetical protein